MPTGTGFYTGQHKQNNSLAVNTITTMEPRIRHLKDGREILIREAAVADAHTVLDYVEGRSGESDFLTFGPVSSNSAKPRKRISYANAANRTTTFTYSG